MPEMVSMTYYTLDNITIFLVAKYIEKTQKVLTIGNHGLDIRGKNKEGQWTYIIDFDLMYKEKTHEGTESKEKKFTVSSSNVDKRQAQAQSYCKLLRTAYAHLFDIDHRKGLVF